MQPIVETAKKQLSQAQSFLDFAKVFATLFKISVPGQDPPKDPNDYKNENSDYGLKLKGKKTRERLNEQAREILDRVKSPEDLTAEDREILKQYSGQGGLTDNSQFEYYTPQHVAEGCWDALKANGFANGNVLDPSTGSGMYSATKPQGAIITGCEIDATSSKVAQLMNPGDSIEHKSFEKFCTETPDGSFDACCTNVPFGKARGKYMRDDPAMKKEKYIHRYFISRIIDKLKPGGLAVLVVPIDVIGAKGNNAWAKFRTELSKKAEFLGAHKLPSKTFRDQGTDTVTDVVVFRKHPKELLDRMESIPFETLQSANVVWPEFIGGRYWQGEGRQFIMGKYLPKVDGDRWSREVVDGDIDDAGLKAKLAARFNSRIDWDMLDAAAPIVRNYADGDHKIINGDEYELVHGIWQKIVSTDDSTEIDKETYGAATLDELKALLGNPRDCLKLTAAQAFAIYKAFPELMPVLAKQAIEFAISQRKSEYWEQLWRGAIIGGMLGRYQANSAAGDEAAGENGIEQRLMLQDLVIAEIQKYGHPSNNKGLALTGESSKLYGMFRNAIDAKGNFSDLLKGTLEGSGNKMEFDSSNLQSIVEYLFIREQVAEITLDDLQKIYSGDKAIGSLGDLAETGEVAVTPDGLAMPLSRYLAGDIYAKLDAMYAALGTETDPRLIAAYERQIAEIEAKRKLTAVENMNFTLQQPWLPKRMIRDFMEQAGYTVRYGTWETMERENALTGKMEKLTGFKEDYDTPFGEWQLATMAGRGYSKEISWTKKLTGFDLRLEGYLNGKGITHNANQSTEEDKDVIQQYREREKALNEGLTAFIQTNPDVETIAEGYNRKFNGYIPFEYSEDDLKLEGINPRFKLHTYQNAAVRRLSEEGSGILGFGVGLGKTASSLALVKYNQQMGRSKRTCIVVPASVLSNWYHEAKGLYGNLDGALFIGVQPVRDKDGTIKIEPVLDETGEPKTDKEGNQIYNDVLEPNNNAEQVYTAMWQIPQSNYKIVVMTKDRFKMIPVKDETVDAFADSMKAALEASKAGQEESKKKKKGRSYQDAVDEANNDARFHDEGTAKEGAYPFFEDMGFTDVILDEAHVAKNGIGPSNRYTGGKVAYLAPPVTSQIAIDMQIKMHHIKQSNNGRGAYLLTATPITNSLIECYNMLALVVPKEEFERRSIYTVDDFINTFGQIAQTQKLDPQGELFDTDALLGYENLDGLRDMFFKYANMKSSDEVKELRDALPEADYLDHEVDMSDEQREAYALLCKQGKDKDKATRRPKLAIIRDMDKVTTDIDLFYNRITWHFPLSEKDKVDAMVADLPASVKGKQRPEPGDAEFDPDKTEEQQKIVVMQIPLKPQYTAKTDGQTYIITTPQAYEESVLSRLKRFEIPEESISHPLTPKYAALIENCKKEMELGGKQIIFTEEKAQHKKVVRLIVHCIPELRGRIGVINADEAAGDKLQQISDLYNSGSYRYCIANRKAEVGVNLQKGTTAIHHLTFPWTKASMIQRNGRGLRQGNTSKKVSIYNYKGKGTFDMYRLDLIEHKGALIDDLVNKTGARTENADANEDFEREMMFETNPEAAKAKMREKVLKAQQEAAAKAKASAFNAFQSFAANTEALASLEERRAKTRTELEDQISTSTNRINSLRTRALGFAEYSESRKQLSSDIVKEQAKLEKAQNSLSTLYLRFDAQKADIERKVKQSGTTLRAKAAKGELPFDAALLDNPGNCVISPDGKTVITVGDQYEVSRYEGAKVAIIKVTAVKNSVETEEGVKIPYKGFVFEELTEQTGNSWDSSLPQRLNYDRNYDAVPLMKFLSRDSSEPMPKKVSYSEKELALMKILAKKIEKYGEIKQMMDKDTFQQYYDKLSFGAMSYVGSTDGKIGLYFAVPRAGNPVVYPDTESETFRKAVAEDYLAKIRAGESEYMFRDTMTAVFGPGYKETARMYGSVAAEAQVVAACAAAWKRETEGDGYSEHQIAGFHYGWSDGIWRGISDEVKALGDNADQIQTWFRAYRAATMERIAEIGAQARAEAERAAQEALKSDPNYKEIPANVKETFDKLGITVRVNTGNAALPKSGKFAAQVVPPFSRWFFQDRAAKSGRLYMLKEQMKVRYSAAYLADAGEFHGSWWHMPSTFDLAEIYKFLA